MTIGIYKENGINKEKKRVHEAEDLRSVFRWFEERFDLIPNALNLNCFFDTYEEGFYKQTTFVLTRFYLKLED